MLPQTIMVDSGAVMALFGLRPRTDVDLLFYSETRAEILGERNGILIEATTLAFMGAPEMSSFTTRLTMDTVTG